MEFTFVHDIQSMPVYNFLLKNWSQKQEPRYFVNIVFVLTLVLYIGLQIKIKIEIDDHFFDFGTSLASSDMFYFFLLTSSLLFG